MYESFAVYTREFIRQLYRFEGKRTTLQPVLPSLVSRSSTPNRLDRSTAKPEVFHKIQTVQPHPTFEPDRHFLRKSESLLEVPGNTFTAVFSA